MKELISKFEDDGDPERMTTCNLGAISYNPPELLWLRIKENYENGGLTDDERCHMKETYDYISVSREFNQWLKGEDKLEYITERVKGWPPMRRSPLRGRRFADFEEENYPKTDNLAND